MEKEILDAYEVGEDERNLREIKAIKGLDVALGEDELRVWRETD